MLLWWWCPLVQRCAGFRGFRTCHRLALVLWWCAPRLLPACLLCACRVACEYGSISRFKGVLRGFYGADVCLYGFGVLLGLCGFCAREVFGGLEACGVFAFLFVLFAPAFISFPAFLACPLVLCLSSCLPCLFLCHCGVCVFFFPFGLCAKRKGAPCWCVLSCPVGWVFVLSDYLNKSATYIIFHTCHIVNGYIVTVKSVPGIIEANKGKI